MPISDGKSYQPEQLSHMMQRLYVYVPQMALKGSLFPLCRDEPIIWHADYSELDGAAKGDLFVLDRGRLLHAMMTASDEMIMVEMVAESAFIDQPLSDRPRPHPNE